MEKPRALRSSKAAHSEAIPSIAQQVYWSAATREMNRALSLEDREASSKTYGCFDRTFWGWKFTDFSGARFQEGVFALAYGYTHNIPNNPLNGAEKVLDWVHAGFRYWQSLQHPDGSFDEAYPEEHSLAATAFTSFYLGEAFLLVQEKIVGRENTALRETFCNAGDWLCENDEEHGVLSNHLAAAAAALTTIYEICGDEKYKLRCAHFLNRIYEHQSDEGWYEEYGGADPGYQTHATFYLATIWQRTQDTKLLESLKRSLGFLKHCIHPNGTIGGAYGSRNTEFYFPAGFEILSEQFPDAEAIARFMRPSVSEQKSVGLGAMDAQNFFPLLNNYLFASSCARALKPSEHTLPCEEDVDVIFQDAGIIFRGNSNYFAVLGTSKGGTLHVFDRKAKQLAVSDCGYWARVGDGVVASHQFLNRPSPALIEGDEVTIESSFIEINQKIMNPLLFLAFRIYSLTLGRRKQSALWIKKRLVEILIRRRKVLPMRVIRKFKFEESQIQVSDRIEATPSLKVRELRRGAKFATVHMGSSRYFQAQELEVEESDSENLAPQLSGDKPFHIERTIHVSSWTGTKP